MDAGGIFKRMTMFAIAMTLFLTFYPGMSVLAAQDGVKDWTRIWGGAEFDAGRAVCADASGIAYVAGESEGGMDGQSPLGGRDLFLSAFSANGARLWSRVWGSSTNDYALGAAADASGFVYVVGYTLGSFDGEVNPGGEEALLTKYGIDGRRQWTRLWGSGSTEHAHGVALAVDGAIYVAGHTSGAFDGATNAGGADVFLSRFTVDGNREWSRIWGSSKSDYVNGLAVDGDGNIYVTGYAYGAFDGQTTMGGCDAFLSRFDSAGNREWSRLWGSASNDVAVGVAIAGGSIYVAGYTGGRFDNLSKAGGTDPFLVRFNTNGDREWSRMWGSVSNDTVSGVTVDGLGNVYVAGTVSAGFDDQVVSSDSDIFTTMFTADGAKTWTRIWGSSDLDRAQGITADREGNVFVCGYAMDAFDEEAHAGKTDAFLTRFMDNGYWYVMSAAGQVLSWREHWGGPGCQPASGDYDGDGASDFAVYYESTGMWFARTAGASAQPLLWGIGWGGPGFVPVPGDYNGDGISDLAVYSTDTGEWFIRNVAGDVLVWGDSWGAAGFTPVPGDYDGDGVSDLAVYSEADGLWYIASLFKISGLQSQMRAPSVMAWGVSWGGPGMTPVSGDYNGDGVSDLAVYQEETGAWSVLTTGGSIALWNDVWGGPGYQVVPGDYDGDNVDDQAVVSASLWFVKTVDKRILLWGQAWGEVSSQPVPGDYDGDGISDLAVYR